MPDKHVTTRLKDGRFAPNSSGNPQGRPPKKMCIPDILKSIGEEQYDDKYTKLEMVMNKAYEMAMTGNMRAMEFIAERLEGRVAVKDEKHFSKPISEINFEGL